MSLASPCNALPPIHCCVYVHSLMCGYFTFIYLVAAWCQRLCKARGSLPESNPVTAHLLLLPVVHLSLGTVCTSWLISVLLRTLFLRSYFGGSTVLPCFRLCVKTLLIFSSNSRRAVTVSGSHGATCRSHWFLFWLCPPANTPLLQARRTAKWQHPLLAGREIICVF